MDQNYIHIFWVFVLLIGIAKCIKIARRETTSRICVYALMMSLIGLLVSFAIQMVRFEGLQEAAIKFIIGMVCLIAFVAALSLGVIGLVNYQKQAAYRQGRKQAVTAIVLSLLFLSAAGMGFYNKLKPRQAGTALPVSRAAAPDVSRFDDLNFQYNLPGKPYVVLDAKSLNKDACFAMLRKSPQIYFLVIAEKIGFEGSDNVEDLVKISQANMQSAALRCSFSEMKAYEVNGLKGIRYRADADLNRLSLSYVFWLIQKNGYSYQLIVFGKHEDKKEIWQESRKLFSNFKQIEPTRIFYAEGSKPFGSYTSDLFGYSMDLSQTPWMRWEKVTSQYPAAEVGAHVGDDAQALIVPIYYTGAKPSLEALSEVLLKSVKLDFPEKAIKHRQAIQESGLQGFGIRYHLDTDGKAYEVRCKILSGEQHGFLVAAWLAESMPDKGALFEQFFGPLHFAPQPMPSLADVTLPDPQKMVQARLINKLGLYYYDSKVYDAALTYFKLATRFQPENAAYLSNCLDSLNRLGKHPEALAFLDNQKERVQENQDILSWKAWHLKQTAQIDQALAVYDRLFSGDYKNDEDFNAYGQLLAEKKQWSKLEGVYDLYLKKNDSVQLRLDHAKILQQHGEHNSAIRILQALQDTIPLDAKVSFALIQNYNEVGQPRKALEISQALIAKGLGSADAYYYKGDAEFQLKWYRKAKQSFEKALALAPQNSDIKDYIKHVSAMLGQGDNTSIKAPIEPVPLPEMLVKRLPAIGAEPQMKGFDSYYLNIVKGFSHKAGEEYKHTTYKRIKVLDAGGVSRFSTMQIDFNPLSERIYVNELIVRDEKGAIASRGDPEDFYTIDSQKGRMATYDQTLCIPVPNLLPGYTIELTATVKKNNPPQGFPFERAILGASRPVLLSAVYYTGEPEALRYKQANTNAPIETKNGLAWVIENPPIYRWEPSMVDFETYMAVVLLGNAKHTWEQLGQDYLGQIEDKLVLDPATRALAARLVKKDPTAHAKITTLAKYVQTNYAYKAIEFGSRGLIPNSAGLTIQNKYGDCKDHALLLHQLLKAASIPSHLALVNTESEIASSLPSLDQFNHMILYVPAEEGGRFFDMTDKDLDLRLSAPAGLANRDSLVLDPEHIRFVQVPAYDGNNRISSNRDIEILESGDLKVAERIALTGYAAGFLRNALKSVERAKLQDWLQSLISDFESSARVVSFNLSNLYENSQALVLDLTYEIKGQAKEPGGRLNFRSPGIWEHYYLDVQPRENRTTWFRIHYPFAFQSKVSIKAPSGFSFGDVAERRNNGQGPFGRWFAQIDATPRKIDMEFDCSLASGVFGPDKYADYHNMMVQAVSSINQDLFCVQGELSARSN